MDQTEKMEGDVVLSVRANIFHILKYLINICRVKDVSLSNKMSDKMNDLQFTDLICQSIENPCINIITLDLMCDAKDLISVYIITSHVINNLKVFLQNIDQNQK